MLKIQTKPTQSAPTAQAALSDADLDTVTGGLNPQPLPPKESFKLFSLSALKVQPSFFLPSVFRF
ncbi:hypothetical protein [Methylobacterium nonmethylotrophicum]|uniref:Uncharacterized protein n=1 Tax=Methylobacterium nonmethylotrophicum TaxID=1141884 RepID=A0A4Z0NX36_9HYPH|nr:hypothetical protein [Methylobacterium nonmethylotrophicum]TGE01839.1 hypothetical protein EU555_03975 [Methylobacterium nonmethylotrophicum]